MQLGTIAVAVLVGTALATQASAQEKEKKLQRADLPAAVQRTADEQSAGATVKGYSTEEDNGQVVYEVEMTMHGHARDVTIGADGTVLEVEQEVALDSLPAAVRTGLKQLAGSGTIGKIESLTKKGTLVAYEAHVKHGSKRSEIQVGPDGKKLAHPE
jgi:uncharacterized cupredoxin-like copper-binding protein